MVVYIYADTIIDLKNVLKAYIRQAAHKFYDLHKKGSKKNNDE